MGEVLCVGKPNTKDPTPEPQDNPDHQATDMDELDGVVALDKPKDDGTMPQPQVQGGTVKPLNKEEEEELHDSIDEYASLKDLKSKIENLMSAAANVIPENDVIKSAGTGDETNQNSGAVVTEISEEEAKVLETQIEQEKATNEEAEIPEPAEDLADDFDQKMKLLMSEQSSYLSKAKQALKKGQELVTSPEYKAATLEKEKEDNTATVVKDDTIESEEHGADYASAAAMTEPGDDIYLDISGDGNDFEDIGAEEKVDQKQNFTFSHIKEEEDEPEEPDEDEEENRRYLQSLKDRVAHILIETNRMQQDYIDQQVTSGQDDQPKHESLDEKVKYELAKSKGLLPTKKDKPDDLPKVPEDAASPVVDVIVQEEASSPPLSPYKAIEEITTAIRPPSPPPVVEEIKEEIQQTESLPEEATPSPVVEKIKEVQQQTETKPEEQVTPSPVDKAEVTGSHQAIEDEPISKDVGNRNIDDEPEEKPHEVKPSTTLSSIDSGLEMEDQQMTCMLLQLQNDLGVLQLQVSQIQNSMVQANNTLMKLFQMHTSRK